MSLDLLLLEYLLSFGPLTLLQVVEIHSIQEQIRHQTLSVLVKVRMEDPQELVDRHQELSLTQ